MENPFRIAQNASNLAEAHAELIAALMQARRDVRTARRANDAEKLAEARSSVNAAKIKLGERGPVWWTDGAKDFNRHLVKSTPYSDWYRHQGVQ